MVLSKRQQLWLAIVLVLAVSLITIGMTYAYFTATATDNTSISGTSYNFEVELNLTTIKSSTDLIPEEDDDIINNMASTTPCVDDNNYEVCSMYRIVLTNNSTIENLNAYIVTSNSTYVTNNLKFRLFTYTNGEYIPVSDIMTANNTVNSSVYFNNNSIKATYTISDGSSVASTSTYYLTVWISEIYDNQSDDQDKNYSGSINFESVYGSTISANFN